MSDKTKKNRKHQEQKITVSKKSISERRLSVYSLDLRGYSNKEISSTLSVSLSTVEKDLHEARQSVREWFSALGTEERFLAFIDAIIHLDNALKELWRLSREEKSITDKIKIFGLIANNAVKKAELFKTTDSYLTAYFYKQKDLSPAALASEEFHDIMTKYAPPENL